VRPPLPASDLTIRPLTPSRMDDLARVQSGGWGSGCWCMYPRLTPKMERALPGPGNTSARRRRAMTALARRRTAPGLLAYRGREVIGWIAVAPRPEFARVDASRATPRADDAPVWIIPCVTVRRRERGRGVAVALIRAAVAYAAAHGAPVVEAYPRAGRARVHDDYAFFGTERLFRKAGFRAIRSPLPGLPRNWTPRVTMRVNCGRRAPARPTS
jgi:GNAT superfamily N-acetyltransferase